MNKCNRGQSIVDLIFSVGIVVLVLSGVVVLMVNSVSTKTKSFDRKTASRMAEVVMERMVMAKENDPVGFFGPSPYTYATTEIQTLSDFPGYIYSIVFGEYAGCTPSCVRVEVTVKWAESSQAIKLDRIFSRT